MNVNLLQDVKEAINTTKSANSAQQHLVFGYIREAQWLLPPTPFWIIPDLVAYTILALSLDPERFEHFDDKIWQTSNEHQTITKTKNGFDSCYGAVVVPYSENGGVHIWKLRVDKIINGNCVIGIDEAKYACLHSDFFRSGSKPYAYACWGEKYALNIARKEYKQRYSNDDVVRMVLNMNDKNISFGIGDEPLTIAAEIEPSDVGYCAAIWIYNEDAGVTLLSYQHVMHMPSTAQQQEEAENHAEKVKLKIKAEDELFRSLLE